MQTRTVAFVDNICFNNRAFSFSAYLQRTRFSAAAVIIFVHTGITEASSNLNKCNKVNENELILKYLKYFKSPSLQ